MATEHAKTDRPQNHAQEKPHQTAHQKPANPGATTEADEPQEAMVTWLGEDGSADDATNVWNGQTFKKGEAVKVTNPHMIATAKTNKYFKVA